MNRFVPRLQPLEDRAVPAIFGNPWPDGSHVTLSFAGDGTAINGQANSISSFLNGLGSSAQLEVLRAFQSWVASANVNIGLVTDGGQAFFSGGAIQGDARFGDIRLGARPLAGDVLAITAPFNLFSSYSGDVVINTGAKLSLDGAGSTRDLFTAMLQESGHTLGVGNSPDLGSVMYEWYQGPRAGLSAGDVASIQALYGARQPDTYDAGGANGTLASATSLDSTFVIDADLTATNDVDCYRFSVPLGTLDTRVSLQAAGYSLVTPRLEVLDATGQVIASTVTTDPLNNNLTIDLPAALLGATYYVRVSGARGDVFGVGSYQLAVGPKSLVGNLLDPARLLSGENGLNDLLASATALTSSAAARGDYLTRSSFADASDLDYYRIHAPGTSGTANLVAAVWGLNSAELDPHLDVYDANGSPVAAKVLTSDTGAFVLQVAQATAGADYYVRVSSARQGIGNYALSVSFPAASAMFDLRGAGTLGPTSNIATTTLNAAQSAQVHFVLGSTTAQPSADMALELTVLDAQGHVVFRLQANDGGVRSGDVFLKAGTYSVQVRAFSKSGGVLAPVTFRLDAAILTDPVGVSEAGSNDSPGGSSPPPSSGGSSGTTTTGSPSSSGTEWF